MDGAYVSCGSASLSKEFVQATAFPPWHSPSSPLSFLSALLLDRRGQYIRVRLMPLNRYTTSFVRFGAYGTL